MSNPTAMAASSSCTNELQVSPERRVRFCARKRMLVPFQKKKTAKVCIRSQESDKQLAVPEHGLIHLSVPHLRLLLRKRGIAFTTRSRNALEERLRLALSKEHAGSRGHTGASSITNQRFSLNRGFCDRSAAPRGQQGNILCRWCGQETASRRKTFCSSECVHQHMIRSSGQYIRRCVLIRDQGICAKCGLNAHLLYKQVRQARHSPDKQISILQGTALLTSRRLLSSKRLRAGDFWHVDHILPVSEGGGACGLDNLRTLCKPCHAEVTRDLARHAVHEGRTPNEGRIPNGNFDSGTSSDELPLQLLAKRMAKSTAESTGKRRRVGRWYRRVR